MEGKLPEWRGVMEHIASGQRYFFNSLSELAYYILPYLEEMNVEIDGHSRFCYQFEKWKRAVGKRKRPLPDNPQKLNDEQL